MEVEYKGANSLHFKTGSVNVYTDPKLSLVGQKDLKVGGSIEVVTELRFKTDAKDTPKLLIEGPGDYEVSGISIKGVAAKSHQDGLATTIYRLDINGFRVAVIGHVANSLSESQLEELGVIDIMALPVGGNGYTLDAHEAAALVRHIGPKIVIPTHYKAAGLKYEVPQNELEPFLKELGATQHETQEKLKLKAGTALPAVLTVIELAPSF